VQDATPPGRSPGAPRRRPPAAAPPRRPPAARVLATLAVPAALLLAAGPAAAVANTAGRFFCKYRPNYLVLGAAESGGERPTTKFQFSFRYTLWDFPGTDHASGRPREDHCASPTSPHQLKFGYTQKALWRLYDTSSPFEENNYNPELYYSRRIDRENWKEITFGIEHESNGLGGADSRSWNRIYLQARFEWRFDPEPLPRLDPREDEARMWKARLYTKAWYVTPWDLEDDSLTEALGYFHVAGVLETPEHRLGSADLSVELTKGGNPIEFERASILVGLALHADLGDDWRFVPDLYLQYFEGYGETLTRATENRRAFRFGLQLTH